MEGEGLGDCMEGEGLGDFIRRIAAEKIGSIVSTMGAGIKHTLNPLTPLLTSCLQTETTCPEFSDLSVVM